MLKKTKTGSYRTGGGGSQYFIDANQIQMMRQFSQEKNRQNKEMGQ